VPIRGEDTLAVRRGEGRDKGNFPCRWNEYVVPGSDGWNRHQDGTSWTQTTVLKFLVVYDRVKESD